MCKFKTNIGFSLVAFFMFFFMMPFGLKNLRAESNSATGETTGSTTGSGTSGYTTGGDDGEEAEKETDNYPADNSGKNKKDADGKTLTPGDQSETKGDLEITRQLREWVVKHKTFSVYAQNIKIITIKGVVTLRGAVNTAFEKESITNKAKAISGVTRVDNQLEIKTK